MGTRHQQMVINQKGEIKLSQYGQWDGYPSGQGKDILTFLRGCGLKKYEKECDKLRQITKRKEKEIEQKHPKDLDVVYPYLSRDCGSKIHQMIQDGQVKFVRLIDQKEANRWCAGFYTINFKDRTFKSSFGDKEKTYSLDNLPTEEEYLKDMEDNQD